MDLNIGESIIYQDKGQKKIGLIKSKKLDNQIEIISFDHENDQINNIKDQFKLLSIPITNILFKANKEMNESFKRKIKRQLNEFNKQSGGNLVSLSQPTSVQQPVSILQPGVVQQPTSVQQPVSILQPGTVQQPTLTPQTGPIQLPMINLQPVDVSQPGSVQQPTTILQPAGFQQPTPTIQYGPPPVTYYNLQPETPKQLRDESNRIINYNGHANDRPTNFPNSNNSHPQEENLKEEYAGGPPLSNIPPKPKADYSSFRKKDESIKRLDNMNKLDLNPGSIVNYRGEKAKIINQEGSNALIKLINSNNVKTVPISDLHSEFDLILNNDPSIDHQKIYNPDHVEQVIKNIKENNNIKNSNLTSIDPITSSINFNHDTNDTQQNNVPNSKSDFNIKTELNNFVEKEGSNEDIQDILQGILSTKTTSNNNSDYLSKQTNNQLSDNQVDINNLSSETTVNKVRRLIRDYERLKEHYNDQHIRFMEICQKITQSKNKLNDFFSLASSAGEANSQIFGQGGFIPNNASVVYIDPNDNDHKEGIKIGYDDKNETCLIRPKSSPGETITVNRSKVFVNLSQLNDSEARKYLQHVLKTITTDLDNLHSRIGNQHRELQNKYDEEDKCWNAYQQGGFNLDGISYSDYKDENRSNLGTNILSTSDQIPRLDQNSNLNTQLPSISNEIHGLDQNSSQIINNNENIYLSNGLTYQIISDDNGVKLIPQTSLSKSINYKNIEIPREFYNDTIFSRGNQGEDIKIKYIGSVDKFKNICKKIFDQNYYKTYDNTVGINSLKLFRNDWTKFQREVDIALEGESKLEQTNSVKPFLEAKGRSHTPRFVYLDNLKQILPNCIDDIKTSITEYVENLKNESHRSFERKIDELKDNNDNSFIRKKWVKNQNDSDNKNIFQKLGSFIGIGGDEQEYLEELNNNQLDNSIISQEDNNSTKQLRRARKETLKKNYKNKHYQ